jgi:hypothetical protein
MPVAEKARQADFVIDTSGALDAVDSQVAAVIDSLSIGKV